MNGRWRSRRRPSCIGPALALLGRAAQFHLYWQRMKTRTRWLFVSLLFAACCFPSPAFADSDSAFCAARGYFAYELRAGITPGVGGQVLRLVKFEPPHRIYLLGELKLEDFQPHRMVCAKDRIEISGWAKEFHKYIIEVGEVDKVSILEHTKDAAHIYELRISDTAKRAQAGLQQHRQAELVQLDRQRNVRQRVMLYERDWLETA